MKFKDLLPLISCIDYIEIEGHGTFNFRAMYDCLYKLYGDLYVISISVAGYDRTPYVKLQKEKPRRTDFYGK